MSIPSSCNSCSVFKNSLFKDFDDTHVSWLADKKQPHILSKKELLFSQGENVKGIYCHLQGLAKVEQKNASGDIQFTRLVLPGDTSGHRSIFVEKEYKGTASVISDSLSACFISKMDVLNLLSNNPSLAKNLIIRISGELNRSEREVISVKEQNVRNRLAFLLFNLANEYADVINHSQLMIKTEITKKDIANLLMVANETIIRLMSDMKNEGLIHYHGKQIVIEDMDKLKQISCVVDVYPKV